MNQNAKIDGSVGPRLGSISAAHMYLRNSHSAPTSWHIARKGTDTSLGSASVPPAVSESLLLATGLALADFLRRNPVSCGVDNSGPDSLELVLALATAGVVVSASVLAERNGTVTTASESPGRLSLTTRHIHSERMS